MGRFVPFIVLLAFGCATTTPPPPAYTPSFRYTPKKLAGGDGISIALVKPAYGGALARAVKQTGEAAYTSAFRDALGRSTLSYFTSAGFTVSGPFSTVDEMTFPEKKQADLLLVTEIDVAPSFPVVGQSGGNYSMTGTCVAKGVVSFVIWEPLSMQRMWSKQVEVEPVSGDCTAVGSGVVVNQVASNALASVYEQIFPNVMRTAERYFSPDEVQLIKKQSLELREKKVF